MTWTNVAIPPGVIRQATPYDAPGKWWDTNNVRWVSGAIAPIGGNSRITSSPLSSKIRKLFQWRDNDDQPWIAIGGEANAYVYTSSPTDVTPTSYVAITSDGSGGGFGIGPYGWDDNPVYTTGSTATVTISNANPGLVTWTAHGLSAGMVVKFTTTGTLPAPLVVDTWYLVGDVVTTNTFSLKAIPATPTSVVSSNDIQTTTAGSGTHTAYQLVFTVGAYGQQRSRNPVQFRKPDSWTFANFGQDLLAVASQDGRLLHFSPTTGTIPKMDVVFAKSVSDATVTITNASPCVITWTAHGLAADDRVRFTTTATLPAPLSDAKIYYVATVLSANTFTITATKGGSAINTTTAGSGTHKSYKLPEWDAPKNNRGVVVTAERAAFVFGADGEPRRVAWSDFEDHTAWNYASTTGQAGYLDLEATSPIVNAVRLKEGILVLTQHEAFMVRYCASPYWYGVEKIGATSFFAPNCLAASGNQAIWLGMDGFWTYDGSAVRHLECPFFNDLKQDFAPIYSDFRSHMHANGSYPEFWLDYVSNDALEYDVTDPRYGEPDKYVIYNFAEGWWARGQRVRTAATGATTGGLPVATGYDNHLYQHEDGMTDAGASRVGNVWAETNIIPLDGAGGIVDINQAMLANNPQAESQNYQIKFLSKMTPNGTETTFGPYLPRADGYIDTRVTGRDIRIRVEATDDNFWSFGPMRLDVSNVSGGR